MVARNNEMLKVSKECKDPGINVVDKSPKPVNNELKIVSTVQEKPSTSTVDKNILESSVANSCRFGNRIQQSTKSSNRQV